MTDTPNLGLSPQQAEALLRKDLANLVRKTAEGAPLTGPQRALVNAYISGTSGGGQSHVSTIVELSKALGCDRRTITRHLKRSGNPGRKADGRYDVTAWRVYLQQFGSLEDDDLEGMEPHYRAKLMAAKVEMVELELKRLKAEVVSVESVRRLGAELGAALRKTLTIHKLASSLVGLGVREIEDRLKEAEDNTLLQLHMIHDRIGAWEEGKLDDPDTEPTSPAA